MCPSCYNRSSRWCPCSCWPIILPCCAGATSISQDICRSRWCWSETSPKESRVIAAIARNRRNRKNQIPSDVGDVGDPGRFRRSSRASSQLGSSRQYQSQLEHEAELVDRMDRAQCCCFIYRLQGDDE